MQYMLLIYEDESQWGDDKSGPDLDGIVAEHLAFAQSLGSILKAGAGLKPTSTATTLRVSGNDRSIHDGPFAETKEQLGGFYLVDVANLDEAIAIANRIPIRRGSIEIRPHLDQDGGPA